ncbi:zinc-binding protein A33-like [Osmerus eperlanus]|uniref:zinc-binding protein A33-like n=1 Tax=Osmerus eperlanus TaxID=29151 RepID=UPI002E0F8A74
MTYQDPVSLSCRHSFCRCCLKAAWEQGKKRQCSVCKRKSSNEINQPDLKLANIVEAFLQKEGAKGGGEGHAEGPGVCVTHRKKLKGFCGECEVLLCAVCVEAHSKHTHQTIEVAAEVCKSKLDSLLKALGARADLNLVRDASNNAALFIKNQAQETAGQIREFTQLHQYLKEEEETRLAALKQEEGRKTASLAERTARLISEMASLSEKITDIENRMETDALFFLKIYKDIKLRAQQSITDLEPVSGSLIDVAQHLGNLRFKVWKKIQDKVTYTPVTLDVNTAHADLLISGGLLEVKDGRVSREVPDNAERFDSSVSVLGSQSFSSGTHSWEVEVGPKKAWTLGVAKGGVTRKGSVTVSPNGGIWAVGLWNGTEFSAGTAPLGTPLTLNRKPQKVRVQLDYEGGKVSFHDSSDMSLIYTFKDSFKERLFPYFSPCLNSDGSNPGSLKICPENVCVTVTQTALSKKTIQP